jgi:Sec-independent protein translocase protein TatA
MIQRISMFAMTHGELAIVLFIFALVWGAVLLPRLGEHLGPLLAGRARARRALRDRRALQDRRERTDGR